MRKVNEIKQQQDDKLFVAKSMFDRELGSLRDLLNLLYRSQSLKKNPDIEFEDTLKDVQTHFANVGLASRYISQVRWIDISGQEIVRLDFRGGEYRVFNDEQLQNKKSRYYVQQGLLVAAPQIYVSPIDLNVEHGKIVKPFEATVRASISTDKSDFLIQGILVINYNLSQLLDNIRKLNSPESELSIVNQDGYWLLNAEPDMEWGFMLNAPEQSLANRSPVLWQLLVDKVRTSNSVIDGQVVSFRQQSLFAIDNSATDNNHIFILAKSQKNSISAVNHNQFWKIFVGGAALFCVGLFIFIRDAKLQMRLLKISDELHQEKQALETLNQKLEDHLAQQQQLQDDLVEAQKLSSLGMMVAGVAHELNTPIGGALMSVSSAEVELASLKEAVKEGLTKSKLAESLQNLDESLNLASSNLGRAANQVKSFKRIAIDRVNEEHIEFDLKDVIVDLLTSLKPKIRTTGIEVELDVKDNTLMTSRPGIISQVLQNLIVNGMSHAFSAQQKGKITITAVVDKDDEIRIVVADNGKGISPDIRETMFEPFVTTGRGTGNTGLGLYFVHQWVTQILQGQISVTSQPDQGTTFTICLPLQISAS
ncbi:sensor histidine kinase [Neptunicella sp. SCSIO 80796]|uniref:sensor histidine kinase n=1 Tax=Neptunicella plasticusilytica TaxID=3117012 RepID=UPI003A4D8A31